MIPLTFVLLSAQPTYPYAGPTFDSFVRESYRVASRPNPHEFYRTMDARAVSAGLPTWAAWAKANRPDGTQAGARRAGEAVWGRIKKTITKFSLDRGFEFTNAVTTNERQCYLQSIIVAGELQRAGYDAGVAMVWSNPKGQTSNNGHAVAVLRAGNRDLVIDCSEPRPVEVHRGLFLRQGTAYRYVEPRYDQNGWILGYARTGMPDQILAPNKAYAFLDLPFLRSQFDYYRGERAVGGVIAKVKTPAGLAASERFYRRSLEECPANPLTRAMLARTLAAEGRNDEAQRQRLVVLNQYARYGWTPDDVRRPLVAKR